MITIIGNMKGGTGKSTLAFNLAIWLAYRQPPLIFDLDPQQTLADAIEVRKQENFTPALESARDCNHLSNLSTDREVIIDVSMSDSTALDQALLLAERVLIPVAPSQADVWSTQRFVQHIQQLRPTQPPTILGVINRADTHPFIPETAETEAALEHLAPLQRIPIRLYHRTAYRRSFSEGMAVFELEPNGKAAREINKLAAYLYPHLTKIRNKAC
ncbi:MAG TPA: ParA family protein [Piscirickettsiaceae bacterium]|nr:ParA family protein [Piscirickettsiaceae bacterium]HIQ40487.1 ParA family protein [Sulfurivirga caldicuralii]